jgi:hypothetical protein
MDIDTVSFITSWPINGLASFFSWNMSGIQVNSFYTSNLFVKIS